MLRLVRKNKVKRNGMSFMNKMQIVCKNNLLKFTIILKLCRNIITKSHGIAIHELFFKGDLTFQQIEKKMSIIM